MSSSQLHVHLGDGSAKSSVSVLFVHVDDDGACQISEHDSVVLDAAGFLFEDLQTGRVSTMV